VTRRAVTRRVLLATGLIALTATLAACGGGSHELVGYTRDPEPEVDVAALPDLTNHGEPFDVRADPGHLLVVYFGYTNCPDFCPTTLSNVARAKDGLGDDGDRVDVAMVTVDPDRDIDVLAEYVQSFVPGAHALATDDPTLLATIAEPFGVSYQVTASTDGDVEVQHTTFLYAVDDTGSLVITWPSGTSAEDIEADLRELLRDLDEDAA
jgi:protein SCO1